jgi:hypothetical protein
MPMQKGWLGRVEIGSPTVSEPYLRHILAPGSDFAILRRGTPAGEHIAEKKPWFIGEMAQTSQACHQE